MSTPFDFANFGNMFGGGMGGTPTGLDALLSEDQRTLMGRNATLAAAAALLQASGRSTTPIGLGQALGSALQAGQQGYTQARAGSVQDLLLNQKLQEAKRDEEFNKLIRDQLYPKADAGVVPQTPGLIAAIGAPIETAGPFGPTLARQALIPPPDMTAAQPTAASDGNIFSNLNPQQKAIVAFNPKAMLPKVFEESLKTDSFKTMTKEQKVAMGLNPQGVYQINTRTGEPKLVQGSDVFETMTLEQKVAMGLDPRGVYQRNTITGKPELIRAYEGAFGSGLQGTAYDTLLNEDSSTAKYALAYRILNQPVPVEKVQPDGSVKIVYEQPVPIPSSFPKPTYAGKLPAAAARPQPAGTQLPTPTGTSADARVMTQPQFPARPVTQAADGPVAAPLPAGAKTTPMAARPEEYSKNRGEIIAAVDFVAALKKMENMVRDQGMQLGGLGEKGASQSAVYEDLLTKARLAAQLGVLNKEDLPRLQAQLSDPTALATYIRGLGGPDAFFAQIRQMEKRIVEEATRKNLQFGSPIMTMPSNFVVGGVAAPSPLPSPLMSPQLLEALRKYPATTR